jgi:hypothetical protein
VTPAPADLKAVLDVVQQGSTVTFSRKDADGTERFEFRVVDVGRAELRFLFNDEVREELAVGGIPLPKPVALTRR